MVKKAIDSRIPALIRNGAQSHKRSFFVVVGDRQKDVIVNLYHILLNIDLKVNKSVLWAYKNKLLGFSSHRQKREKKIKAEIKRGTRDADTTDPFELFISTQDVRYVYYKESEKILGNTFGMCILQDFEAITPNLLARTIETVQGGGLVILLLKGMKSLKQLYTLSMDVHSRYRTEAHSDVIARFNERFILSLGSCDSCLVVDDELNVLPISGGKSVQLLPPPNPDDAFSTPAAKELATIKENLADTQPIGSLISLSKTVDQATALLTFVDAISEKNLQSTVALTAARGRGKSAALGIAIAAAVAHGYSNIFVTSPSPENLKTLFDFIFKAFDALGYEDHVDYSIIQSTNPSFHKAIVRVNVYRQHRQTIQYINPEDTHVLGQAELLVIDEAAAIPLPLVRKMLGPYLIFLSSTINGYEGTGRSLSLKLFQQLRDQANSGPSSNKSEKVVSIKRKLREITLAEPIRYAAGDSVEKWLHTLLCLDATLPKPLSANACPHPSKCDLLIINRDTLFSFHPVSERFLQSIIALYVASHYKNSPNDLQLMSDAPAHQLYVLVPPIQESADRLPEPLCVIQVALEGEISKESLLKSLMQGRRENGDLIPWLVSQQFQDEEFASLSGARVVRIATNPDYLGMGYGSRALSLLSDFFKGKFASLSEGLELPKQQEMQRVTDEELEGSSLLQDNVKIRDIQNMPPLFARLSETRPARLDYLGVSYGLTPQLHKFWVKADYAPVYLRQTPNDLTGEHSCVMLQMLEDDDDNANDDSKHSERWIDAFTKDFHKRFLTLLSYEFRSFASTSALSIEASAVLKPANDQIVRKPIPEALTKSELDELFSPYDLKRLEKYADQMVDYHLIVDLLPNIATLYFNQRLNAVSLSRLQQSMLLAIGLQRKKPDDLEQELNLAGSQLLGIFIKIIRKFTKHFATLVEGDLAETIKTGDIARYGTSRIAEVEGDGEGGAEDLERSKLNPLSTVDEALDEAVIVDKEEKERLRSMIDALPLHKYLLDEGGVDWNDAEKQVNSIQNSRSKKTNGINVSVETKTNGSKRKAGEAINEAVKELDSSKPNQKKHKQKKK